MFLLWGKTKSFDGFGVHNSHATTFLIVCTVKWIGHAYQDLSLARIRSSPMGHRHVVQHQNVSLLPGKGDLLFLVRLTTHIENPRVDSRAITVVGIERKVRFVERFEQRGTHRR